MLKSVKGHVVFLPLPVDEHAAMIPKGLAQNHELHILVNGKPTKKNIIWQDVVRIDKVKKALVDLARIKPLYSGLMAEENDRYLNEDSNENDDESIESLNPGPNALLEKLSKSDAENLYVHCSIHPIHSNNPQNTMDVFKMKECQGEIMSVREKQLDLLCFPVLFPTGRFGKHDPSRLIKVSNSEFYYSRLLNKDGRFRRNQQYLFHLLHQSDMKYLSNSISHILRQTKGDHHLTVDSLLQKIQDGDRELECNLSFLFSNIRGTRQYRYSRQTELNCMRREFGSPTFFVTLSSAEYNWDNLNEHLLKMNSDIPGIQAMTPGELCVLDPVNVVLHFPQSVSFHPAEFNPL